MRRRDLVLSAGLAWARPSRSQAPWPSRPITLIVPFAPGGIADITARTVARAMSAALGQTIIVDNRPSAGSVVATAAVAKAAPDGYTLLLMSNANAVSTGLFKSLPFDVVRDLAPITTLGYFGLGIFVSGGSALQTLQDLIRQARARPGRLTLGSIAVGSTQHLSAELFKTQAGIDVLVVPYKGTPAVLTALRAGEVDVAFEILGPMLGQVGAHAVRVLAVTSDRRDAALPDVPTVLESGVSGYSVASWNALAAPSATPAPVIERLNRAAAEALGQPAVRQSLQELGVRAQPSSPKVLQDLLASEIHRWGDVIRAAKIEPS